MLAKASLDVAPVGEFIEVGSRILFRYFVW
jgi:hypothetical protein